MVFELNLRTEKVDSAYPTVPLTVEPDVSIEEVFALLKANRTGSVLVCRDGVLVGIFTERDALKLLADDVNLDASVETVMVPSPTTIGAEATVAEAIKTMSKGGYRRLPIVDDEGRPQGMVKVSGIVRYLVEHFPQAVYNLPPEPNVVMEQREGA